MDRQDRPARWEFRAPVRGDSVAARRACRPAPRSSAGAASPRDGSGDGSSARATQASLKAYVRFRQVRNGTRRKSTGPVAGWSSPVARRAHNPKVGGSNPPPATNSGRSVRQRTCLCLGGAKRSTHAPKRIGATQSNCHSATPSSPSPATGGDAKDTLTNRRGLRSGAVLQFEVVKALPHLHKEFVGRPYRVRRPK